MLSVIVRNMLSNHRNQGEENPANQPEPDDFTSYKNEVVGERRNAYDAQFLSVPSVDSRGDCLNQGPVPEKRKKLYQVRSLSLGAFIS